MPKYIEQDNISEFTVNRSKEEVYFLIAGSSATLVSEAINQMHLLSPEATTAVQFGLGLELLLQGGIYIKSYIDERSDNLAPRIVYIPGAESKFLNIDEIQEQAKNSETQEPAVVARLKHPENFAKILKNTKRTLAPLVFAAVCLIGAEQAVDTGHEIGKIVDPIVVDIADNLSNLNLTNLPIPFSGSDRTSSTEQRRISTKIGFAKELTDGRLFGVEGVWEIENVKMDPTGYYTQATSKHIDSSGNWEIENTRVQRVVYPSVEEYIGKGDDFPHITLSHTQRLGINSLKVKIPIKNNSALEAISALGSDGKPYKYEAHRLSDETVEIEIQGTPTTEVTIKALFTPSLQPRIKARSFFMEYFDKSNLSDEVKQQLAEIEQSEGYMKPKTRILDTASETMTSIYTQASFNIIPTVTSVPPRPPLATLTQDEMEKMTIPQTRIPTVTRVIPEPTPISIPIPDQFNPNVVSHVKQYFLDHYQYTLFGDNLEQVRTIPDLLNTIAKSETCDCDICNGDAVLITNILEPRSMVNLAFGFGYDVGNPVSPEAPGSLTTDNRHAWMFDADGFEHDATPKKLLGDPKTLEYVNRLRNPASEGKKNHGNNLAYLGGLLTLAAGLTVGMRLRSLFEEHRQKGIVATDHSRPRNGLLGDLSDIFTSFGSNRIETSDPLAPFTSKDLALGADFFGYVSWGGGKKFRRSETDNSTELRNNYRAFRELRLNSSREKLKQYLKKPKTYEDKADLSHEERNKMHKLARLLTR